MEARRSRLERMQTMPNIKLISPTLLSGTTVLDATPEIPPDDSCTQQQQQPQPQRRAGKPISFVKRMSEGRFFLTDRTSCRQTTSPILKKSPLLATTSTLTSTSSDTGQLQQLNVTLQSTAQPAVIEVECQELKDVHDDNVGGGGGDDDVQSGGDGCTDAC